MKVSFKLPSILSAVRSSMNLETFLKHLAFPLSVSLFVCLFFFFFYNTFILMIVEKQIWKKNGAWSDPIGIPITYWKTSFPSLEKQLFSKPSSLCKGCLCKNNWRFFVLGDLFNIIFISRYIIPSLHWNENQLVQTTS